MHHPDERADNGWVISFEVLSVRFDRGCPFDSGEWYEGENKDLNENACAGGPGMETVDGSGYKKAERCCVKGQGLKPSHQSNVDCERF